ncbi:MAG: DNA-formamidopyrimidine glycosylase [Candidatus Nealsonbacteria bacterium]|nr:DNA-formamidopyrimidine glycosylase [Candidatus Nealsonbacteria bacterium]
MPELPEVETTIRSLKTKILGRIFFDVWTDFPKQIKRPKSFNQFKKEIKGEKIQNIWRRGKNIIFTLSKNKSLLIHQKLTGHLLVGKWTFDKGAWHSEIKGPLQEKTNSYIHLLFTLDNGQMLALSDLRKFAKAELWTTRDLENSEAMKKLGPEPLEKNFSFEKFLEALGSYLKLKRKGKIKQVLMDQNIIAGIGNIYSDEILWRAKIHPFKETSKLKKQDLKNIYRFLKDVLKKSIVLKGESFSDFRTPSGEKGEFDSIRKAYQREGEKCSRCKNIIKRVKMGNRSTHFCPKCQKL